MLRKRVTPVSAVSAILFWVAATAFGDEPKANPFIGTWVMNVAKSQFQEGKPLKSYTAIVTDAGAGKIHVVVDCAFAKDGAKEHVAYTATLDGQPWIVEDYPEADLVQVKMTGPSSMRISFFKGTKRQVEWLNYTVSADGKTMHGSEKGNGWRHSITFDRQ